MRNAFEILNQWDLCRLLLYGVGNLVSLLVVKGKADNNVSYASE